MFHQYFQTGLFPKRFVFQQGAPEGGASDKPKYDVEDKEAKAEKILKSPDSFDADKDFNEAKAKIDDIAKKYKIDTATDADYKAALAKLEANKTAYKETQAFARDKIKYWPKLSQFAAKQQGGLGAYRAALEASKGYDSLITHWGPMAGMDAEFRDNKEAIKSNIDGSLDNAVLNAFDLYNDSLDATLAATSFTAEMPATLQLFHNLESALVEMSGANFEGYTGDKGAALTKAQAKLAKIAEANKKVADLQAARASENLKYAESHNDGTPEAQKRLDDAKKWESGSKQQQAMEKAKSDAILSRSRAEGMPGADKGKLAEAQAMYVKAEQMMTGNFVEAAKLFSQAKQAYDAMYDGPNAKEYDDEAFKKEITVGERAEMEVLYRQFLVERTQTSFDAFLNKVAALAHTHGFKTPPRPELEPTKPYNDEALLAALTPKDQDSLIDAQVKWKVNQTQENWDAYMDKVAGFAYRYGFGKPPRAEMPKPPAAPGAVASAEKKPEDKDKG